MLEVKLLMLLFAANSAPVLAHKLLGSRWQTPVDGGRLLGDGRPLFGASKTWRGIVAAILLTAATAMLLGLPASWGVLFGLCSMLGDLLSSFIKRRMGKPASSQALVLDQIPEALLPLLAAHWLLDISWVAVIIVSLIFMLVELSVSPLLCKWGIRAKPY